MRLHTNTLTRTEVREAARVAGSGVHVQIIDYGSRKRNHAFEVTLTGTSNRRPNSGTSRNDNGVTYAATWDEWGMFFAALYTIDSEMIAGAAYANAEDFHYKTGNRFDSLTPAHQHPSHRWEFAGIPRERECTSCEAVQRW